MWTPNAWNSRVAIDYGWADTNPCTELPGQREAEVKNWGIDVDSGAISDDVTLVRLNMLLWHCLKRTTVDWGADDGSFLVGLLLFQRFVSLVTLKRACAWPYRPLVFASIKLCSLKQLFDSRAGWWSADRLSRVKACGEISSCCGALVLGKAALMQTCTWLGFLLASLRVWERNCTAGVRLVGR